MRLSKSATIGDVWSSLTYPRQYVAAVRHKLLQCDREHGNAHVSIGITGSGQKPCYRIFWRHGGNEVVWGSFWDQGTPLDIDDAVTANWSDASMSFIEVDSLLKEKIGWKAK
jgi:hypothetical protein